MNTKALTKEQLELRDKELQTLVHGNFDLGHRLLVNADLENELDISIPKADAKDFAELQGQQQQKEFLANFHRSQ